MAARFVMLAFAALTLAACETASIGDNSVRRGASPTLGNFGHRGQIRGPVVADEAVAPARARHAGAARRGAAAGSAARRASVVPNPMRSPNASSAGDAAAMMSLQTEFAHRAAVDGDAAAKARATAPQTSSGADAASMMSMQTELAHQEAVDGDAAGEAQTTVPDASSPEDVAARMSMQTDLVHQAASSEPLPVNEPIQTTSPIDFGLGSLTTDKIEAMFGGMPFLLIASIAAALVAALGLALRSSSKPKADEDYAGPHLVDRDREDYREPYAA
jgi:hypothetical protein